MSRPRNFVMLFTQPIVINISVEHVFFTAHYHSWYPGKRGVVVAPFFTFCQLFVYFRCSRAFGFGMTCCLTPGKLWWTPMTIDTSGTRWTSYQFVASVTLKHDLAIVTYFSHVWSVFVEAHGPDQKHLAVFHEPREWAEHLFAPGSHSCPITKETLCRVMALEHVPIAAFKFADHSVI